MGARTVRQARGRRGGPVGDLLVAACACLLTVTILGSAVYVGWKLYERYSLRSRAETFVASLQNRTPEELEAGVAQLAALPKVARYVLPEVQRALYAANSEQQMVAAIRISRAFVDDKKIRRALFRLRRDAREAVAAAAVEAIGGVSSPDEAAGLLGECLVVEDDVPPAAAVVDEACAGLARLGEPGRAELRKRLGLLSADRRLWLVGYVDHAAPPDRRAWLELMSGDQDSRVGTAAAGALERLASEGGAGQTPERSG